MAEVSIAILGLGRVGISVGLALKRYNDSNGEHRFTICGYDSSPENVKTAQKIQAVDKTENRPDQAVRGRDIVLIAMPYAEVIPAYEIITSSLRPGAVVLDMSLLKQKSLDWASKHFSSENHVICMTPIVNPKYLFDGANDATHATPDYFDSGVMVVMPSVSSIKEAITLAADFSRIIGSKPHFMDPAEHDVLMSSTEALPQLLGIVYFNMLANAESWGDAQRLVNPSAGAVTHSLFDTHPDDLRAFIEDTRSELVRHIDEYIERLRNVRTVLAGQDRFGLESLLDDSSREYEAWINRRHNNRWQDDERLDSQSPGFGSLMGNVFGGFLANRNERNKKD